MKGKTSKSATPKSKNPKETEIVKPKRGRPPKNPEAEGTVKKKNYYVDPEEFKKALVKSYKANEISTPVAEIIYKIATRLAFNPSFINYCVDEQTMAVTYKGCKRYDELTKDDLILAYDLNTNEYKFSKILNLFINEEYDGPMYQIENEHIDALVTPGHNFVVEGKGLVKVENLLPDDQIIWSINYLTPDHTEVTKNFSSASPLQTSYKGVVWCPTTEFGTFVCRRGIHTYITGNSYKEEMIGDAMIKMLIAVKNKKYDPKRGSAFSYFNMIAYHSFQNRIKKENKEKEFIYNVQEETLSELENGGYYNGRCTTNGAE